MFDQLLQTFASLAGVAGLIAGIVNVLKRFGVVVDGDAPKFVAALNLLGLAVLFALQLLVPDLDIHVVDSQAGVLASMVNLILMFLGQMGVSRVAHAALKGVPVVGFSHSEQDLPELRHL